MNWQISNVGWPISINVWNNTINTINTKHRILPISILEPYKITVLTYGQSSFESENYKGRNINLYE